MLRDPRFLRLLVLAVGLHTLWNAPFDLPFLGKYLVIGFVAWLIILSLVQASLKEIRCAQEEPISRPPPAKPHEAAI
jgi:RsiW-degrading membrane proteinase PrsW (M82 family)